MLYLTATRPIPVDHAMKPYLYSLLLALALTLIGWAMVHFDPAGQIFNIPGLLVVLAGTFLATVLGQSLRGVINLLRQLPGKLVRVPQVNEVDVELFVKVSEFHRQANVRYAELATRQIGNAFLRGGALMVLDRTPFADIHRVLQCKIAAQRERDHAEIQVFLTMLTFAPAFGMVGTLFGLIGMLYGLDMSNLRRLGEAMGFAMLTTVYGLLLANLVLKPIVSRLEQRSRERLAWLQIQQEAILMLHDQCHTSLIRECLESFGEPSMEDPELDAPMLEQVESPT